MSIHNVAFSTASLAKTMLSDLDRAKPETVVATQTLELLLVTIIDLAMPTAAVHETAARIVAERARGG